MIRFGGHLVLCQLWNARNVNRSTHAAHPELYPDRMLRDCEQIVRLRVKPMWKQNINLERRRNAFPGTEMIADTPSSRGCWNSGAAIQNDWKERTMADKAKKNEKYRSWPHFWVAYAN